MTAPTPPCPLCGYGAYHNVSGLYRHLSSSHPILGDRERSDAMHEWLANGGRRR